MQFVDVGGLRLAFEDHDSGPETILFVHGWTGSHLDWRPVIDRLPAGFRSVALDLRGAGDSDKPDSGYTIKQYSDDVFGLARSLGLKDFTYVGHSMGGTIGFQFLVDHQDLLKAAVLCAPTDSNGYAGWDQNAIDDMRAHRTDRPYHLQNNRAYYVRPVAEDYLQASTDQGMRVSDGHLYDSIDAMRDLHLADRLADIRVPVLFVAADRDEGVPPDMVARDFERTPGASFQVFHRSNHSMMVEVPDQFTTMLIDFVQSVAAPAGAS